MLGIFYLNPVLLFQTFPFFGSAADLSCLIFFAVSAHGQVSLCRWFWFLSVAFPWPAFGSAARLLRGLGLHARRLPDHLRGKSFWVDVAGGPHSDFSCVHTSRAHEQHKASAVSGVLHMESGVRVLGCVLRVGGRPPWGGGRCRAAPGW